MSSEELTLQQRAEADRIHAALVEAATEDLRELADLLATKDDSTIFGDTEFAVRDIVLRLGAKALEASLKEREKNSYDGSSGTCPECGESAKFQRWQAKCVVTTLGELTLKRAYYHCRHCHSGHDTRDHTLGLSEGHLSRGAVRLVTLAGTLASFAEASSKILPELCNLRLCESTIERTTERIGAELGKRLHEGETFGPACAWKWTKDASGQGVAYISADLTGVGMQGEKACKLEGRMAAIGMIFNAGVEGQARYVCGISGGLAELGEQLRRQAAEVGISQAKRWVAISDGGSGLEDWLRGNFPLVEAVILDFYHAAEHLNDWAKARHPGDAASAQSLAGHFCHRLKHEGGSALLAELRGMETLGWGAAARESHRELLVYFGNQEHRMDYPRYRANGWMIGSGPVESACKQVVGGRLKGSGMRWGEEGADAVCHLRALFKGEKGQWDAFWAALPA